MRSAKRFRCSRVTAGPCCSARTRRRYSAQVLGACHASALRVCVERCDNFVGDIPNKDISHAVYDIASSAGLAARGSPGPAGASRSYFQGLRTAVSGKRSKSVAFRVTTVMAWINAVAPMKASR